MSTPLWEQILDALLKQKFDISISGENDAAWGFSLCVLGLVCHLTNTGLYEVLKIQTDRTRNNQEVEHDKLIFKGADTILSEQQLDNLLYSLDSDHSYYMSDASRFEKFFRFLAATNNSFLSNSINEKTQALLQASLLLREFMSYKFFVYPKSQSSENNRLCLVPGLNCDRDGDGSPEQMKKYDDLSDQLVSMTDRLLECYIEWRTTIKKELVI